MLDSAPTTSVVDQVVSPEETIRRKILHQLKIYPRLSPSMLNMGIGTAIPPAVWKPVLERLISDGKVLRENVEHLTPVAGRKQLYTVLSLTPQH